MFKLFFVDLCNINRDLALSQLQAKKPINHLNKISVRIYHIMFGTGK